MANHLVQARVSEELKEEAEMVFSSMGMTTSDAIRIFLQQTVNIGGLPFRPIAKVPNHKTVSAINEARTKDGITYDDPHDLFKDLDI